MTRNVYTFSFSPPVRNVPPKSWPSWEHCARVRLPAFFPLPPIPPCPGPPSRPAGVSGFRNRSACRPKQQRGPLIPGRRRLASVRLPLPARFPARVQILAPPKMPPDFHLRVRRLPLQLNRSGCQFLHRRFRPWATSRNRLRPFSARRHLRSLFLNHFPRKQFRCPRPPSQERRAPLFSWVCSSSSLLVAGIFL